LLSTLPAATLRAEPTPLALADRLNQVLDAPAFASALWGIEVRGLRTGSLLYSRNNTKSFTPASVVKLFVTAAALDVFGPDERPRTTVETQARVDRLGRVLGDVRLVGRGDPALYAQPTSRQPLPALEVLADALRDAGLTRVEGRVLADATLFAGARRAPDWAWDDLVWWYGAEVAALSFNDNTATLRVGPGESAGDPALVERFPLSSYYTLDAEVRTAGAGTRPDLRVSRELGRNHIELRGVFPLGAEPRTLHVALEDPPLYAATVFEELLRARGIVVTKGVDVVSRAAGGRGSVLAAHEGPTLAERITAVNKNSQNLHAELLLRLLGARVKGQGSPESGLEALVEFLGRAGVPLGGFDVRDGSGLSSTSLVTPEQVARLLTYMHAHPQAAVFAASLPLAGSDGSLKTRLVDTPAAGALQAKTGTLTHVHALAGYVTGRDGDKLAFAALLNRYSGDARTAQAALDALALALTE
jgi:PBP4 family serine-type D-alanyl-D-alanine carboxypeptidase